MPRAHVVVESPIAPSFRAEQVAGMFDLDLSAVHRREWHVDLPAADGDWQIGAIVGSSGSGKSTIARATYADAYYVPAPWPASQAIIDALGEHSIHRLTAMLSSVGLATPPHWLRPFSTLSQGEQFRAELARSLLLDRPLVVFDEYASTVDRTIACTVSAALSKSIRARRIASRFIAVTCHADVLAWLSPDWILDVDTGELSRGSLQRPAIEIEVVRCRRRAWERFRPFHYLSASINPFAECYLATWDGQPAAFVAVLNAIGVSGVKRISRLVVRPEFQGLGIGRRLLDVIAQRYRAEGNRVVLTTGHPAMMRLLAASPAWQIRAIKPFGHGHQTGARDQAATSWGRPVVSAEYCGPALLAAAA